VSNRQCRACRLLRYKFDPEATKARRLKRYAENKESERAYQQGWVKKNQAYVAADCLARYLRQPGQGEGPSPGADGMAAGSVQKALRETAP